MFEDMSILILFRLITQYSRKLTKKTLFSLKMKFDLVYFFASLHDFKRQKVSKENSMDSCESLKHNDLLSVSIDDL